VAATIELFPLGGEDGLNFPVGSQAIHLGQYRFCFWEKQENLEDYFLIFVRRVRKEWEKRHSTG